MASLKFASPGGLLSDTLGESESERNVVPGREELDKLYLWVLQCSGMHYFLRPLPGSYIAAAQETGDMMLNLQADVVISVRT